MTRQITLHGAGYDEKTGRMFVNVELSGLVNPRGRAYVDRDLALDLIRSLAAVLQVEEANRDKPVQARTSGAFAPPKWAGL